MTSKTVDELIQAFRNSCEKVEQAKRIGSKEEKTIVLSNQLCEVSIWFSTLWEQWMVSVHGKNCTANDVYPDYATAKSIYDSIVRRDESKPEPKKTEFNQVVATAKSIYNTQFELNQMYYFALDGWLTACNKIKIGWKRLLCSIRRKHDMKHVGHFVDQNAVPTFPSEMDFYRCTKCGLNGVIYRKMR